MDAIHILERKTTNTIIAKGFCCYVLLIMMEVPENNTFCVGFCNSTVMAH